MWKAIQTYFFQRAIRQLNLPMRVGKLRNLSEMKSVGLLFNAQTDEQINEIKRVAHQLEGQQKQVTLLGFIPVLKKDVTPSFPFFTRKDVSFSQVPGGDAVRTFTKQSFDLLIVIPFAGFSPFTYITMVSAAQLKAGQYDEQSSAIYDFMIKQDAGDSTRHFIDKLLSYLQQIDCHG